MRPSNAWVDLDGVLEARFGFFRLSTPLENIASYRLEGPWLWLTAIGVRRGWRRGDLTFGGSPHGGVRLDFRTPLRLGPLPVPILYVTVDDLEAMAAALEARGIHGEDARKRKVR